MSMNYNPSDGATYDSFWAPIFLGYRDITGQAPIDKVAYPGVSVRAACSPDNVYDKDSYEKCISNLLAAEFRRLIIDLYWDSTNRRFNLCPVELPYQDVNTTSSTSSASPAVSSPSRLKRGRAPGVLERQTSNATTSDRVPLGSSIASLASPTVTTSSIVATATGSSGSTLYQLGQYQCSRDLDLQAVLHLLNDYIESTSDQVLARIILLQLNLHAAVSPEDPNGPALSPSSQDMPSGSELVGNILNNDNLQNDVYTMSTLLRERSNLNASWYAVGTEGQLPFTYYFTVNKTSTGDLSTPDGWPNEQYLLFTRLVRLLVSWGTVDSQMEGYDFQNDSSVLFPPGYMQRQRDFDVASNGDVTSGCYYNDQTTRVSRVNDSWAMGFIDDSQDAGQGTFINNLTACGIMPVLNTSLSDSSAADNYTFYQQYTEASIFGWATGEPRNTTSPGADVDGEGDQYRCVVIDSSDPYHGHWHVDDCQSKHRVACRINNEPYNWRLSSYAVIYGDGPAACQDDTYFSLPRTGLENTYLYQRILDDMSTAHDGAGDALRSVWINLNSLDVQDCWVTSGPNGSCIYNRDQKEVHSREILIPTIAALIVLFLSVLTVLVKCNNNIRHNRRSKTGPGGWEYEGVPS